MWFGQENIQSQRNQDSTEAAASISPLIDGGLFCERQDSLIRSRRVIKKRYDEFIIGPRSQSSLDQAGSYRYSLVGGRRASTTIPLLFPVSQNAAGFATVGHGSALII